MLILAELKGCGGVLCEVEESGMWGLAFGSPIRKQPPKDLS